MGLRLGDLVRDMQCVPASQKRDVGHPALRRVGRGLGSEDTWWEGRVPGAGAPWFSVAGNAGTEVRAWLRSKGNGAPTSQKRDVGHPAADDEWATSGTLFGIYVGGCSRI
jgi:hypothetical protein